MSFPLDGLEAAQSQRVASVALQDLRRAGPVRDSGLPAGLAPPEGSVDWKQLSALLDGSWGFRRGRGRSSQLSVQVPHLPLGSLQPTLYLN